MTAISTQYLGQLVPPIESMGFSSKLSDQISTTFINNKAPESRKIQVWVASSNALKVQAAKKAVLSWAASFVPVCTVEVKGIAVTSDISEQPHSKEETEMGARNRLTHLKDAVRKEALTPDVLQFFVSMENGVMQEKVEGLGTASIFVNGNGNCWIDRCYVVVEIAYTKLEYSASAFSEGVTTPLSAVREADATNWTTTCGTFIENEYGFPAKDWHSKIAGKEREVIIQDAITTVLGISR